MQRQGLVAIFFQAILSWVNPDPYHPIAGLLNKLTAPVVRPVQGLMPPIGGLDLSPMVAMIGLVVLKMLLIPPLELLTASPFR